MIASSDPDHLPPPPFWRTRCFAFDVLPRRPYLDPLEIRRIILQPERKALQRDGRQHASTKRDLIARLVLGEHANLAA